MIVEELVSVLGLEIEDDDLPRFQKGVGGTIAKLASLTAIAAAGAAAISSLLDEVGNVAATSKFSRSIDVGFESLQRLEFAADQVTGSAGSVRGVLQGLQQAARGAANGLDSGALVAFGRLGVSATDAAGRIRQADELLLDIADSIAMADNQDLQLSIAEQLGLGPDLNLLLRLGSEGINALGDEAERLGIVLDDRAARGSERFTESMRRLRKSGQALLVNVGLPLVEWLNEVVNSFQAFATSETGSAIFEAMGGALEFVWDRAKLLMEPFKIIMALWEEFGPAIKEAFAPLGPVLEPIAGFLETIREVLLMLTSPFSTLNDLRVFFQGGDSLLGRFLQSRGIDGDAVRGGARSLVGMGIDATGDFVGGVGRAFTLGAGLFSDLAPSPAAPVVAGGGSVHQEIVMHVNGARNPDAVARRVAQLTEDNLREAERRAASPVLR